MAASPQELEKFFQQSQQEGDTQEKSGQAQNLEQFFQTPPSQPQETDPATEATTDSQRMGLGFGVPSEAVKKGNLERIGENLGVGLTRLFGFPGDVDEALFTDDSFFPTSDEIQSAYADIGVMPQPGEEEQDFVGRFLQEGGTTVIPAGGVVARGSNLLSQGIKTGKNFIQRGTIAAARNPGKTAAVETSAAGGAAGGGLAGEEMFPETPQVGRAIGELAGGLFGGGFGSFIYSGGGLGAAARGGKRIAEPFTPKGGKRRATERVSRGTRSATEARQKLEETKDIAQEVPELTSAQRTNDPFMAQLEKSVRENDVRAREQLSQRTANASRRLKQIANRTGDVEDVRRYLDMKFKNAAAKASAATQSLRKTQDPSDAATKTRQYIDEAYKTASNQERRVWQDLPSDIKTDLSNAKQVWEDELRNITEGADKSKIPAIIRNKLGDLRSKRETNGESGIVDKQGRPISQAKGPPGDKVLKGGSFGKKPSAKAVHQFYSELGEKIREEANKASPSRNKLRRLREVRDAVWQDLTKIDGGEQYEEAVGLSRDLNRKFTSGPVGEVLGFTRTGGPVNTTETLDALMGKTGEAQRNAVKQLLEASPQSEEQVKDFVRSRFMDAAFNRENNRVVPKNAANFLNKYRPLLKEFPDLKKELRGAAKEQKNLDELLGASDVTEISARARQQRAAGVFLQSPPGEEIQRVISSGKRGPKNVTNQFESLVREVKQDETGNALKGLKSAFTDYVMTPSRMEDASGEVMIDGRQMLDRLEEYGDAAVKSGMLERDELNRLKKIGRIFEGIQTTEKAGQAAEGVIDDTPAFLLRIASRMIPARATQFTPSGGAGVGLQEAQIAASEGQSFVRRLTNKGAYHLLTQFVQDKDVADDLLKNVENMSVKEQRKLIDRLKVRLPQGALAPAASEAVQQEDNE